MGKLFRIVDAATYLGVSRSTIYRLIATGELTTVKIGSVNRVSGDSMDDLIARGIQQIAREPVAAEAS